MLLHHSYNLISILQIFLRIISVSIATVGAHVTTMKQVRTMLVKFSDSQKIAMKSSSLVIRRFHEQADYAIAPCPCRENNPDLCEWNVDWNRIKYFFLS